MCGISGIVGSEKKGIELEQRARAMIKAQEHRGPDDNGLWISEGGDCVLGHNRLSIIDLSSAGHQPMFSADGNLVIIFNGELYNYIELRSRLSGHEFRTATDTEVIIAAYEKWGPACLDHFIGMFAIAIWDRRKRELFIARDRFGVKPLFYALDPVAGFCFASEIKSIWAAGFPRSEDEKVWATYFTSGLYDHGEGTFWKGIRRLLPGHYLTYSAERGLHINRWYNLEEKITARGLDARQEEEVAGELLSLLLDTIKLRFRADVPVGLCLSGGFDSSLVLALTAQIFGHGADLKTFTFYTGDERYDEVPWVQHLLAQFNYPSELCRLTVEEIPELAQKMAYQQDEPYGGFPTLGMAKVYEAAQSLGITVLLDGNGVDEGWGGYEYYANPNPAKYNQGPVQGSKTSGPGTHTLIPEFSAKTQTEKFIQPLDNMLQNFQWRDIAKTKIPRAMRFADRASMMHSIELREPFLDHRIIELGLAQPDRRKVKDGLGKILPRKVAAGLMPGKVSEAPKRAVQTPQREWLKNELSSWADDMISRMLSRYAGIWFERKAIENEWQKYKQGATDNSFYVWQWINLGLLVHD
jgi:asparagine synthase (glutamine-hydrolysing)